MAANRRQLAAKGCLKVGRGPGRLHWVYCRTGAGGAQMFKEEEKGITRINFERTQEAIGTGATIIASACPFCNTMLTDGIKHEEKETTVRVMDIAELIQADQD